MKWEKEWEGSRLTQSQLIEMLETHSDETAKEERGGGEGGGG